MPPPGVGAPPPMVERGRVGAGQEGTSLLECFSIDEVQTHLHALRRGEGKGAAAAPQSSRVRDRESAAAMSGAGESACRACGGEKLFFEPCPVYCANCQQRIKRGNSYFLATTPSATTGGEVKQFYCTGCHSGLPAAFEVEGARVAKAALVKLKNDENIEEPWVACDNCHQWFHQLCVLFNGRRNDAQGGEGSFHCPNCILADLMAGTRTPTVNRPASQQPVSALPETHLSRYLERFLSDELASERAQRARVLAKASPEEVPGAEGLCIRVVSCVDKRLDVKPGFYDAFQKFRYPEFFSYRSKALLLFQRIEGVDVCLFSMYVQEYGGEQPKPNSRRVYLSYLDSVKYFRPEVVSARGGQSLRTFVYQTILVGYLRYVKQRGFTTCYIWVCPPVPGEDYILYCHPSRQKTPKVDKLRDWYLQMLAFAQEAGVVTSLGNLHDELNLGDGRPGEQRSAADVPYFDGDYWPGAAEEFIAAIREAEREGRRTGGGSKSGGGGSKRAGKGKRGEVGSVDEALMQKLGEQIGPMKTDFIMAHLWPECYRCRQCIEDNTRWSAKSGPHFELCNDCYGQECALPPGDRHPHELVPSQVPKLADTTDPDETVESELFEARQNFLSLCQGNHFQFDTLRRAKHSSMMVLYHLHNPSEPAFVATCNVCQRELEPGTARAGPPPRAAVAFSFAWRRGGGAAAAHAARCAARRAGAAKCAPTSTCATTASGATATRTR